MRETNFGAAWSLPKIGSSRKPYHCNQDNVCLNPRYTLYARSQAVKIWSFFLRYTRYYWHLLEFSCHVKNPLKVNSHSLLSLSHTLFLPPPHSLSLSLTMSNRTKYAASIKFNCQIKKVLCGKKSFSRFSNISSFFKCRKV